MSDATAAPKPISRWRLVSAQVLGWISMSFTGLWLLANGFVALQVANGAYEGPEGLMVALFLTIPIVYGAGGLALLLAGVKRARVAIISMALYWLPFSWMILEMFFGKR